MVGPPYMTTNFYADVYFRKTPRSEEVHRTQFLYMIPGLHPRANKPSSYADFYCEMQISEEPYSSLVLSTIFKGQKKMSRTDIFCPHYVGGAPAAHVLTLRYHCHARGCPSLSGGRILPHNRTVDDAAAIIDAGIEVADEHYEEIRAAEAQQMEDRTRRKYRNRLKHIYRWWTETYPKYFEVGTRVLS